MKKETSFTGKQVFKNENIWAEIKADHRDEETGITYVDAWITGNDDEEGKVIATIDDYGNATYVDERAKSDKYAQEVIQEARARVDDERHKLVDKVIEQLKDDFKHGDYTSIDEILIYNVSTKVLRASLPEENDGFIG
jgi:N-methylhydantoinase B/oxoprolinase/acetone carboxylase alpha subunit